MKMFDAIVVAAGRGERAQQSTPKQFAMVQGKPLLWHVLQRLCAYAAIERVVVVVPADDISQQQYGQLLPMVAHRRKILPAVIGGNTRQDSVWAGMQALQMHAPAFVAVHDAARPWLNNALLDRLINAAKPQQGVMPVLPVRDTVRYLPPQGFMTTPERAHLHVVQTPQLFCYQSLCRAFAYAQRHNLPPASDDVALFTAAQYTVTPVLGDPALHKYTDPYDFVDAQLPDIRVGHGYDVHAFDTESTAHTLWLGGVKIPHQPLLGHSDADVLLHALTDALLGVAGAADIGLHFPPSQPEWRGMSSAHFVRHAVALLQQAGGHLNNIDVTLIGESPKVSPYREAIRCNVAQLCGLDIKRCNIKATTTEKLGFLGRCEGLACEVVVSAVF